VVELRGTDSRLLRYTRSDYQVLQSYFRLSFESIELHVCGVMLVANIQSCVAGGTLRSACEPGSKGATSGSALVACDSAPNPHNASSFPTIRTRTLGSIMTLCTAPVSSISLVLHDIPCSPVLRFASVEKAGDFAYAWRSW
jgi:hypothetical protein